MRQLTKRELIRDIIEQATRKNRAADDHHLLVGDLEIIERKAKQLREMIPEEPAPYDPDASQRKYEKNKKYRENAKKRQIEEGEKLKEKVKPGDVVKCRGTKDGLGLREVLEVDDREITARKLIRAPRNIGGERKWVTVRDHYITTHGWDKVVEILKMEIHG